MVQWYAFLLKEDFMENILFEKTEDNSDKSYLCQYVVCAGSNSDPIGMSGLSHYIEHFVIHTICNGIFPETIKIHGFTSFYYTCYYWYVSTREQGVELFDVFDKSLEYLKSGDYNQEIFTGTKQEIINEICNKKSSNKELEEVINFLNDRVQNLHLPIGIEDNIARIQSEDTRKHISINYRFDNTFRYIYDRTYKIYLYKEGDFNRVKIKLEGNIHEALKSTNSVYPQRNACILIKEGAHNSKVKLLIKSDLESDFINAMMKEIFVTQICEYLQRKIGYNNNVFYENLIIDRNTSFIVITINGIGIQELKRIEGEENLTSWKAFINLLDAKGFYRIICSLKTHLLNYNLQTVTEKDVMLGMTSYAAFEYPSIWLLENLNDAVKFFDELTYEQYWTFVYCMF